MFPETCPTVRVKADNEFGFKVVNEADVTPEDVLFDAPEVKAEAPEATQSWSK